MRALILALVMLATPIDAQARSEEDSEAYQRAIEAFERAAPQSMSKGLRTHCTIKTIGKEPAMEDCMIIGALAGVNLIKRSKERDLDYEIIFDFCLPDAHGDLSGAYACYVENLRAFLSAFNAEKAAEDQGVPAGAFDHCWRLRPDFTKIARCARIAARREGVTLESR